MTTLALLASPFLGPTTWEPVCARLRAAGRTVVVPRLAEPVRTPDDVLRGYLDGLPDGEPIVLVPHSNAGLYVAALAAERPVAGVVFVDAGLPSAGPATPTAPEEFRDFLAGLADADGLLPPWTQWWSEDVAVLFPDDATRDRVVADQHRLPLSYVHAEVPSPAGWEALPAAYVAFGDGYAPERAEAQRRGWPVETLAGEHLHQLVDPDLVAATLTTLVGRLPVA